ncbi:MAG: tetratricopeptide repeat protein [Verrucomicrobia bacterium]|nr:tetratricopeptide repeat protein [Verrucomicrobiota bacterium]
MRRFLLPPVLIALIVFPFTAGAQKKAEPEKDFDPFAEDAQEALEELAGRAGDEAREFLDPEKVTALTKQVKPALVTVRQMGRDGGKRGTGSGFVAAKEGLVVTNLHVIGEGQPIEVEFADGSKRKVVEVTASDRHYDLAVLKLEPGKELAALSIGDSAGIRQGDLVLGFGAPQGLAFSVVPGAISAIRKLEPGFAGEGETPEFPMLQLAMPIEQGNSGGPVVNLKGEVLGIVTLRHRVTENLGFAVPSNDLKALLAKPNPVPMARWSTIGTLDPRQWTAVMGADWTQRGGVITGRHPGDGFGGRALCLSSLELPSEPYEVAVKVKLDDESGAAGLTFASDGNQVHYGFYPSDGKMRLTRFEGADVYSWSILEQVEAPSYVPGDWNRLRVRVGKDRIVAWVNEVQVLDLADAELRGGKAGLCKFRQTVAEFREFRVGRDLSVKDLSSEDRDRLNGALTKHQSEGASEAVLDELGRTSEQSRRHILDTVESLEQRIADLRALQGQVHLTSVERELIMALDRPAEEVDLFEVGLQIARIDEAELDLEHYRSVFSQLVKEAGGYLAKAAPEGGPRERSEALRDFLFKENGFHGSRGEYYHHANSYVNRVLDDREGLPITLSVIFIELARRLNIPGVYGAALPGKFMVGWNPAGGDDAPPVLFDVFEGGKSHDRAAAGREAFDLTGAAPEDSHFTPAEPRDVAVRMLRNLVDIEINRRQTPEQAERFLELLLAIEPDAAYERFQRAILRVQAEKLEGAKEDLDWLLEHRPPGLDYSRLEQFRESLPE